MRLILLGSGEFGLPTFARLAQEHDIAAVVTQPDRPAGRGRHLRPSPVGQWAGDAALNVFKALDVNDASFVAEVAKLKADAAVVIAFGQKLGEPLLSAMGRLAINLHASLLPRYRGAAPINWAIMNGEEETGVSVIALAQRMDAGLIYAQEATPIDAHQTAGELHDRLAALGPTTVAGVLADFAAGRLRGAAQDDALATRAPKLSKSDAKISFEATARQVRCRVHGLTPWPGVQVTWRRHDASEQPLFLRRVQELSDYTHEAEPGTVLENQTVAVRDGAVRLLEVQVPGGKPLAIEQFILGHPLRVGEQLTG